MTRLEVILYRLLFYYYLHYYFYLIRLITLNIIALEHGVDRFRKLCPALLVDAASIDPHPCMSLLTRQRT